MSTPAAVKAPLKSAREALPRESRITVLTLLKYFYDEQIFALLAKDFFNSDLEISLAAIQASASLGNEAAVPHLYTLLERGKPAQQLAAIQTLATINAPSSIERLAKYFTVLRTSTETRREILKAINRISALHPQARELNATVLMDPSTARDYYGVALAGLLEAGELEPVKGHLLRAPPDVQRLVFYGLLSAGDQEAAGFLEEFRDKTGQFDPNTLGCYLCAYELKAASPQANYVIDQLAASDRRATSSFLISLSNYNGSMPNPERTFRLLLRLPYVDQDAETLTGTFLTKLVEEIRTNAPLQLSELAFSTSANLEAVFAKIKKQLISLKGIKEREALLAVLLARLLEQYAPTELLDEVLNYFRTGSGEAGALVARIREVLIPAPEDDQNRFDACLPLFSSADRLVRLNTSHALARVDPATPALLRRLNRLVRVTGILELKAAVKKLLEVLSFAREERVNFLEETSVVTLCQLLSRAAIEQAKAVFAEPARFKHSLNGFIRGARFVPVKIFLPYLLKLLLQPQGLAPKTRDLIVDTLRNMDLADSRGALPHLVRAMRVSGLDRNRLLDLAGIVARYGDSTILPLLLELVAGGDTQVAQAAIRTLRNLARREKSLPLDVLTSRLYLQLEHKQKSVRIEALLALLTLQDDYAVEVLDDYVKSGDEEALVQLLGSLDRPLSHEMVLFLLKLLRLESAAVHRELRQVLPEFCQGAEAEEIRGALLDLLKGKSGPLVSAPAPTTEPQAGIIEQAKLEFMYRRENAQVLTVFFTDLVNFTGKGEISDPLTLMRLIKSYEGISLPTISALRGTLIKKLGDGLLAVFKHPLNAVVASLQIQHKIEEYNQRHPDSDKFQARIGLNSGEVYRKEGDVYGDTVNVASRIQSVASAGEVWLTQATYEQIKDFVRCTHMGDMNLKGKAKPVPAYAAQEILVDIKQLQAEAQQGKIAAGPKGLSNLKESMFAPDFRPPEGHPMDKVLVASLQGLFKDFVRAAETLTKDHHEEYVFKHYLQQKWLELFPRPKPTL